MIPSIDDHNPVVVVMLSCMVIMMIFDFDRSIENEDLHSIAQRKSKIPLQWLN